MIDWSISGQTEPGTLEKYDLIREANRARAGSPKTLTGHDKILKHINQMLQAGVYRLGNQFLHLVGVTSSGHFIGRLKKSAGEPIEKGSVDTIPTRRLVSWLQKLKRVEGGEA